MLNINIFQVNLYYTTYINYHAIVGAQLLLLLLLLLLIINNRNNNDEIIPSAFSSILKYINNNEIIWREK